MYYLATIKCYQHTRNTEMDEIQNCQHASRPITMPFATPTIRLQSHCMCYSLPSRTLMVSLGRRLPRSNPKA